MPSFQQFADEAMAAFLQQEWAGPYMARISNFTEEEVQAGKLAEADEAASAEATRVAHEALIASGCIGRIQQLEAALEKLADVHHRTIKNSLWHDPENIDDWRDCPCLTCKEAKEALGVTNS